VRPILGAPDPIRGRCLVQARCEYLFEHAPSEELRLESTSWLCGCCFWSLDVVEGYGGGVRRIEAKLFD
jgi:hypothetical protein